MSDIEQTIIKLTRGVPARGVPAIEAFPIEEIIACSEQVLRDHGKTLLQYQPAIGFPPLREVIASQAGVTAEQVVLSNGSIQLFAFLAEAVLRPGDVALVERPSYDRTITTLRRAGAKVVGIPLEDDGIDIAYLDAAVEEHHPRLLYLIPDFQNPTGVTTSLAKREAIVSLAREHDLVVVEDLPYRRLRYQGSDLPTLRELDAERVIQLSSFSKLLSPGIRVGWMVGPVAIANQVIQIATDTYITPNMLGQGLAYEFLHGQYCATACTVCSTPCRDAARVVPTPSRSKLDRTRGRVLHWPYPPQGSELYPSSGESKGRKPCIEQWRGLLC